MTPNKVKLTGYKRFNDTNSILDRKLIAIVGPNEAGKSSFFNALLSLENDKPYNTTELTRGQNFKKEDTIVRVEYLLNKEEKELVTKFNGIGTPRFYCLWKTVEGRRFHELIGEVHRDKSKRKSIIETIDKTSNNPQLKKFFENNHFKYDDESISLKKLCGDFLDKVSVEKETLEDEILNLAGNIQLAISTHIESIIEPKKKGLEDLQIQIKEFIGFEREVHPKNKLLEYFDENRPTFVFFSNEERFLKSEYNIEELKTPNAGLNNLLHISEINIEELLMTIVTNDNGRRLKMVEKANKKLFSEFSNSWSQSEVYPQFLFDVDGVKIQISYVDTYTEIQERSDGLKQFIALKAFLANKKSTAQPILLIDEAEIHLHYSAQSDLIKEFEKQKIVNSIIYSTHSAGCLPSDLGTGVRVVEPLYDINKKDTGLSIIRNSIWQIAGGFSPILLAMGANIIAFTLARKAIIAEGPSETILLPRLLRESNNLEYLDFQVAPGIASVSKSNAKSFELEAAKVIYLVDGDEGGKENKKKLKQGGVSDEKIIELPNNYSIEDFVKIEILKSAIIREFENAGKSIPDFNIKDIPENGRIKWFEEKCGELSHKLPSKVKIAENISKIPSDEMIFEPTNQEILNNIYNKIMQKLNT